MVVDNCIATSKHGNYVVIDNGGLSVNRVMV